MTELKDLSPWKPTPPGVYMAIAFGGTAIGFMVVGFYIQEGWYLFAGAFVGGAAIWEAITAAYTAGLRAENRAMQRRYSDGMREGVKQTIRQWNANQ